ncbi:aldehyde dehydrogenase [Sphingosinicella sp.]|uniref:aldehyde dehydrogenase n=1 Tax=Sphingosinicella sp. TaxID=1917971 RepID=UPI0035B0E7B1
MSSHETVLDRVRRGRFLIGDTWREPVGRRMFDIVTPSDETVFASVPCAAAKDIDDAVAAARNAFDEGPWPRMSPVERAAYLTRIADALEANSDIFGNIWTHEVGGLIGHAGHMVAVSAGIFRDYARLASEFPFIERHTPTAGGNVGLLIHEPVGVVGAIIPWNGPILMLASKLAPALLAGCTVVVKMSPEAPLEAVLLGEICQEIGLPPGVVNVLMADREESELLVRHEGVDKISFTGSSAVGQHVASICGARMARATLELGGKSAAVVLDDAPIESVVQAVAPQVSMMGMQFCSALSRVVVPRHRHDRVVEGLAAALGTVRVGDPFDPATEMGPMSMRRQLARVEDFIASGKAEGLTLATGGARPAGLNSGFYIEPTVFGDAPPNARVAREEIFGPVITVIPARDEEDAIAIANATEFGLNNSVFTADPERFMQVARRLRSGTVGHNAFRSDFGIAFGGFKRSGIGREGGRAGLMPYLESKTVIMDEEPAAR